MNWRSGAKILTKKENNMIEIMLMFVLALVVYSSLWESGASETKSGVMEDNERTRLYEMGRIYARRREQTHACKGESTV